MKHPCLVVECLEEFKLLLQRLASVLGINVSQCFCIEVLRQSAKASIY
jgi:hypothetical protein